MYLLTACKVCFYVFEQLTALKYLQVQNYNLNISSNGLQKVQDTPWEMSKKWSKKIPKAVIKTSSKGKHNSF